MNVKVTVVIFAALLAGLAVLNLLTPSKDFSETENRYLQQWPKFSTDALMSGKYTADIDQYITDQFVFRDGWVGMKTQAELALQKHSSNSIYFAQDNYLIEMFSSVNQEQYSRNLGFVGDFTRRMQEGLGVQAHTMLVPTPSMILVDKLPENAPEVDQRALLNQAATVVPGFVDVSTKLIEHNKEYLFYRTDHHWTSLGAFYSYDQWREIVGLPGISESDYNQEVLSDSFYGTTYSKANLYSVPADIITAYQPKAMGTIRVDYNNGQQIADTMYERSFLEKKDKYSVFLNANQPLTHIATGKENGKKLLLIKDSYANAFVQMLLADYEDIYVIDLRYFKQSAYDFCAENGVTDLLMLYSMKGFSSDTNLFYLTT